MQADITQLMVVDPDQDNAQLHYTSLYIVSVCVLQRRTKLQKTAAKLPTLVEATRPFGRKNTLVRLHHQCNPSMSFRGRPSAWPSRSLPIEWQTANLRAPCQSCWSAVVLPDVRQAPGHTTLEGRVKGPKICKPTTGVAQQQTLTCMVLLVVATAKEP